MDKDKLLPCPFCGEEAEMDSQQSFIDFQGRLRKRIAIYCTNCPAEVGMCYDDCEGLSKEMVIPLWNRRAVRVEVREVEQNAAQEGSQAETDESRRDGAHRSPVASKRPDADVSKGSNPECLIGAENCPPAAAPTHDALAKEQVQWMQEFESWLRSVCFQKPTPEAYDLARCAWNAAALRQSGAGRDNHRARLAELDYLLISTGPAGQWESPGAHAYVKAMIAALKERTE